MWFLTINHKLFIELKVNNLPKLCYFCNYGLVLERHHIIPELEGGEDYGYNIIYLCPNHHSLLHLKLYMLFYHKNFFYLKNLKTKEIIKPIDMSNSFKVKLPEKVISYILKKSKLLENNIITF